MRKSVMTILKPLTAVVLSVCTLFSAVGCNAKIETVDVFKSPSFTGIHNFTATDVNTDDYILKNGVFEYTLVIPETPSSALEVARQEFVLLFKHATGVTISSIVRDDKVRYNENDKYISFGDNEYTKSANIEYDKKILKNDGGRIITKGKSIFLLGGLDTGVITAVYDFMQICFNYEYYYRNCIQIKNTSLNNIVIENPMSKSDVQSGKNYSIAGLAARNHFELKGDWTNVYTITPLAFEMSYREMFTPNEGQDKTGQGTWAYFDYLAVAENVTEQQIADYWTWGVYSEEHINAETIAITGVKSFASRASMALSENDLTSFNNNDCWVVENGIPVWKNLLEDYRLTEKDFVLKTSADGNAFTDNISFEFTDTFGNSLPLETKISLVNSADSVCVDVADNQLSKNPDYLALTDKKISVKVTASVGDIEIEKIVEVTLRQNTDSLKQETISGLYIEADGTIKGLNAQQLAKLQDAIYRSAVDGVDINYENGKLSTEFLSEVELGSESSILAISKDTVYTLNYLYVTKAIGDAEDLRVFTVKPAEVAEGETKHATEVSGYYVLTKNIDASQLVLDAHSGYKATYYPSPNEDKGFTGTLDGQGYTISNLTVKGEGLFSVVYGATIKNIGFVNGKVEAGSGYTAFFAHKMILCELSNVYVHVVSLNGTKTTQSILTNSTMHKVKMTNVVIDYDQTAFDSGEYYSALGLIDGKSTTNQGSWKNVYTISATPLALDDGHIMVASNQSEEKINALKDKFLSGQTVNVLKVDGVKSYDSIEDLQKAKEDLSGFTDSYWDISNGAPVWKTA